MSDKQDPVNNLYNAILNKNEEEVSRLLSKFSNGGIKPDFNINDCPIIITAIKHSSDEIVLKLLEHTANPNTTTSENNINEVTPLHIAAANDDFAKKTQYLVNFGAKIDAQDSNGDTALHLAVRSNALKTARVLLEEKANITIKNNVDWTSMDIAHVQNNQEMITLFKEAENNQDVKDETFSLSLTSPTGEISDGNLKMLLEGVVTNFIEESKLDFADRDNYVFKFTGKSSYNNIINLISKYSKLLAFQANDIYGINDIMLLPNGNASLEKEAEVNMQLGGEIHPLNADGWKLFD